jgi:hypothetical protein
VVVSLAAITAACNLNISQRSSRQTTYPSKLPEMTVIETTSLKGPAHKNLTAISTSTTTPTPPIINEKTELSSLTKIQSVSTKDPLSCNRVAAGVPFDVTIPDGSLVEAGRFFSKTWRLINVGSCQWTPLYSLVWFSGEPMSALRFQHFQDNVQPGESVDVSLDLIAPDKVGIYQSNWFLQDGNGHLFGLGPAGKSPLWVKVEVVDVPTATQMVTSTSTPTPPVYIQGKLMLKFEESLNLDNGEIGAGAGSDVTLQKNADGELQLDPIQGGKMGIFGQQEPGRGECQSMELKTDSVPIKNLESGMYLCIRTNQSLPGTLRIVQMVPDKEAVYLEYLTWLLP